MQCTAMQCNAMQCNGEIGMAAIISHTTGIYDKVRRGIRGLPQFWNVHLMLYLKWSILRNNISNIGFNKRQHPQVTTNQASTQSPAAVDEALMCVMRMRSYRVNRK